MNTLASSKGMKMHPYTNECTTAMKTKKKKTLTDNHCQLTLN